MTVLRNEGRWDRSNVIYQDGRVLLYDKTAVPGMQYIDYGLSAIPARSVVEHHRRRLRPLDSLPRPQPARPPGRF